MIERVDITGIKAAGKCMPKELIIVNQYFSWECTIYHLLKSVLYDTSQKNGVMDKLIDFLKKKRPEIKLYADASQIEDYIYRLYNYTPSIAESLANKILDRRMYLRAYHACRPTDIKSYYENGIIPLNEKYIRDYFNQKDYPDIIEEKLASAIKFIKDGGTRFGKIYFVINPEIICKRNSNYLKKGSESLSFIAYRCNVRLQQEGQRPTFFVCNVPVLSIPTPLLEEISAVMLNIMFRHILEQEVNWAEFNRAFYIDKQLSKENIVDHFEA